MQLQTIRRFVFLAALVMLLPPAWLNARLDLERNWLKSRERRLEEMTLPDPAVAQLLSLNYSTLAADVMWFILVAQHGEFVRYRSAPADNVLQNAVVLARTDPYFNRVYDWAPGAYLNRRWPITDQDLDDVAGLLEIGMEAQPSNADLRLSAALLYVGYGKFEPETLIEQAHKAIGYLDEGIPVARDELELELIAVRRFFWHRIKKFGGRAPEDTQGVDASFWFKLYVNSTDQRVRRDAEAQLKRVRMFDELLQENVSRRLTEHRANKPFVPFDLWTLIHPEREP